ncbi:MAG: hypothetical protein ACI9VR_001447 [Cognaticolwellia sp.]|jgi:hypothetical protein
MSLVGNFRGKGPNGFGRNSTAEQVTPWSDRQRSSQTGLYWADCDPTKGSDFTRDVALAEKLWAKNEETVAGLDHRDRCAI